MLRLVHRIVVRRWAITICASHCGSEVGCYDWYTVLWFGGGFFRMVHRIVIRSWVVTIGTPHCGSEVSCYDRSTYCDSDVSCYVWYTAL